jgi:hypothetical protein
MPPGFPDQELAAGAQGRGHLAHGRGRIRGFMEHVDSHREVHGALEVLNLQVIPKTGSHLHLSKAAASHGTFQAPAYHFLQLDAEDSALGTNGLGHGQSEEA